MVSTYLVRKQVACRGCLVGLVKNPGTILNGNDTLTVGQVEAEFAKSEAPIEPTVALVGQG